MTLEPHPVEINPPPPCQQALVLLRSSLAVPGAPGLSGCRRAGGCGPFPGWRSPCGCLCRTRACLCAEGPLSGFPSDTRDRSQARSSAAFGPLCRAYLLLLLDCEFPQRPCCGCVRIPVFIMYHESNAFPCTPTCAR